MTDKWLAEILAVSMLIMMILTESTHKSSVYFILMNAWLIAAYLARAMKDTRPAKGDPQ